MHLARSNSHTVNACAESLCSLGLSDFQHITGEALSFLSKPNSYWARWPKWLERELTDRKVRGSNLTSATRLPLSRLGQLGSIPALMLPPRERTRARILPGCPSLDRGSRVTGVGFEPRTFRSVNSNSNHLGHLALVYVQNRLSYRLHKSPRKSARMLNHHLQRTIIAQQFRSELAQPPSTHRTGSEHVDETRQNVKGVVLAVFIAVCLTSPIRPQDHWMSSRSLCMIDARKSILAASEYSGARKSLKHQIVKSLRKSRELWWTLKAREMKKAFAKENSHAPYQLIRSTGPRKATRKIDGSLIHSQKRRLGRWAEHFDERFSWPPATQPVEIMLTGEWNVNFGRLSEDQIRYEISVLKREKAPGQDGLYPTLFKEGGKSLNEEKVPAEWCISTVIPIFKRVTQTICEYHQGISLVAVASNVPSDLILRMLSEHRERQIRENQAGFRPAKGCIDYIFILRQVLEQRYCSQQPTMVVLLDLRAAFDSCLCRKGFSHKFLTLLKALHANFCGRVKVYGKLSPKFTTSSGVRQGCALSPFLFNFVIDAIMEDSLSASNACGVEVIPGSPLTDIEYADDMAPLGSGPVVMQTNVKQSK
ncbi:LOW QUALITY PROTEIN: hypothetical protein T265_13775 [Opisthorchis viverrini]|uniref:Reverse transcriptase domain-containing protein n=1 Tax=Opisthorchis viverrini TaxID=6198 RepID=A0A074ZVT2_OPIVI|nr:LOW QUALITY PROTEIN: hypothetical protein T265_13775 [Opisthorchis viverrini]KER27485.1 LOW QUALITY PROTEIN: hypothetical protein T265_13775 [Opisthorchis viverrini]